MSSVADLIIIWFSFILLCWLSEKGVKADRIDITASAVHENCLKNKINNLDSENDFDILYKVSLN